jgi:hypothetical protein
VAASMSAMANTLAARRIRRKSPGDHIQPPRVVQKTIESAVAKSAPEIPT